MASSEKLDSSWWKCSSQTLKISGPAVSKVKETSEFGVALGAKEFTSGQHEFEFSVSRVADGYVYVGVATPTLALDQTFCRREANDQVWYYFGCGYTNALRNGWSDVVSKEIGGSEMKIPKLFNGDKVRAMLDMDAGQLRFALFRAEEGIWKDMPGLIENIKGPVVAACCVQERTDAVTLSESARADYGREEGKKKGLASDRYAHVQSKLQFASARKVAQGENIAYEIPTSTSNRAERVEKVEKSQRGDRPERVPEKVGSASQMTALSRILGGNKVLGTKPTNVAFTAMKQVREAREVTAPPSVYGDTSQPEVEFAAVEVARQNMCNLEGEEWSRSKAATMPATMERAPTSARHGNDADSHQTPNNPPGGEGARSGQSQTPRDHKKRSLESGLFPQVPPPPPHRLRIPNIANQSAVSGRISLQPSRGAMKENCSISHAREMINKMQQQPTAPAGGGGATALARQRSTSAETLIRSTTNEDVVQRRDRAQAGEASAAAPSLSSSSGMPPPPRRQWDWPLPLVDPSLVKVWTPLTARKPHDDGTSYSALSLDTAPSLPEPCALRPTP